MESKDIAIWVLALALIGAIIEVPNFFLNQVLTGMLLFAAFTFVICLIVSAKKRKKFERTHPI